MPNDLPLTYSKLGAISKVDMTTSLQLDRWEYSPKKNFMELALVIKNSNQDYHTEFSVKAVSINDSQKLLKTKIVLQSEQLLVIQIVDLPKEKEWEILSVAVRPKEQELTSTEQTSSGASKTVSVTTDSSNYLSANTVARFSCDYRTIAINNELGTKTETEYLEQGVQTNIEETENSKVENLKAIDGNNAKILVMQGDISKLESDKKYQTDEEQVATQSIIGSKANQVEQLNNKNMALVEDNVELDRKLEKLRLKITDLQSESTQAAEVPPENPEPTPEVLPDVPPIE